MTKKKKVIGCVRWCWKSFCVILFTKKNLGRDLIILTILIIALGGFLSFNQQQKKKDSITSGQVAGALQEKGSGEMEMVSEEKQEQAVSRIQAEIDTNDWIPYQNTWYGFTLKYPRGWKSPVAQKKYPGAKWEQKIDFLAQETGEDNPFSGFQVTIYNLSQIKELSATEEFPRAKTEELQTRPECASIEGHLLETGDYPAEEIYIPATDDCYNATLFFSNTRGDYIYNFSSKLKNGMGLAGDPSQEIADHLPEFFAVASKWELIDIRRPQPVPPKTIPAIPNSTLVKSKASGPMPVSYVKDSAGRLVCAKSNDKPGKSDKGKGKHLDMECCLDPDEYPNPHCYYPVDKYGKYLK